MLPRRPTPLLLLLFSLTLASSGCKTERPEGREEKRAEEAIEHAGKIDQGMQRAEHARDLLQKRMMGRVMEAVAEGGHASAVEVCNREAASITRAVGEELGVKIGRVSDKMRNPENRPPLWVESMVEDRPGLARQSRDADGSLHAIFPILIAEPCLKCHGTEDALAPGVKDALAKHYPDDQATGYAAGDLRGWFWVEVPPT
jgi:hypothetical protein